MSDWKGNDSNYSFRFAFLEWVLNNCTGSDRMWLHKHLFVDVFSISSNLIQKISRILLFLDLVSILFGLLQFINCILLRSWMRPVKSDYPGTFANDFSQNLADLDLLSLRELEFLLVHNHLHLFIFLFFKAFQKQLLWLS